MAPRPDLRAWLPPIGAQLWMGAVALLAGGIVVQAWVARGFDRATLLAAEGERARTVAALAAADIDGAQHEALATSSATTFADWEHAPDAARALHADLAKVSGHAGLELPVVTMRVDDAALAAIRAAPDQPAADALHVVATSDTTPTWKAPRAYIPEMAPALLDGVAAEQGVIDTPDGPVVTAWAPVREASGRVVGVVEVRSPVDQQLLRLAARSGGQAALLALIGGGALVLLGLAVRRYTRGTGAVRQAARRLSQGDLTTALDPATVPEVARLAGALEDARLALAGRAQKVKTYAQRLSKQRDLALRGIDDAALARREAFKQARAHIEAAVRVGESGPVPVLLADLSYRRAAVKAEPTLDLAVGAPVRLRVRSRETGKHVTVPATIHGRLAEGDKSIEYALQLGVDGALVDFPDRVAGIMNGRDATRITPAEGDAVCLHILVGDRRIKGTVEDLSASGGRVRLARPATTVARWGTRLAVELELPGQPKPVPFTVEISRIHDDGGKRPLVGMRWLEGREGRFATRQQAVADYVEHRLRQMVEPEAQAG